MTILFLPLPFSPPPALFPYSSLFLFPTFYPLLIPFYTLSTLQTIDYTSPQPHVLFLIPTPYPSSIPTFYSLLIPFTSFPLSKPSIIHHRSPTSPRFHTSLSISFFLSTPSPPSFARQMSHIQMSHLSAAIGNNRIRAGMHSTARQHIASSRFLTVPKMFNFFNKNE